MNLIKGKSHITMNSWFWEFQVYFCSILQCMRHDLSVVLPGSKRIGDIWLSGYGEGLSFEINDIIIHSCVSSVRSSNGGRTKCQPDKMPTGHNANQRLAFCPDFFLWLAFCPSQLFGWHFVRTISTCFGIFSKS